MNTTQEALAVAQLLDTSIDDRAIRERGADTIKALCAEVERLTLLATATHIVMAERDALRDENEKLNAEVDNIKQVEFPRRLDKVVKPIIAERDTLRTQLEPVAWRVLESGNRYALYFHKPSADRSGEVQTPRTFPEPLYTHPAPQPDHTAVMQQALEALQVHSTAFLGHEQPYVEAITALKEVLG